jgi:hypothetical protein
MCCQLGQGFKVIFGGGAGIVGVDAHGGVDPVILLGEWDGGVYAFGGTAAAADGEDRFDPGGFGAVENGGAVCVKLCTFEMGVGVYYLHLEKRPDFGEAFGVVFAAIRLGSFVDGIGFKGHF